MEIADPKNTGVGCCPAGKALDLHVPFRRRCRQFRLRIAALEEQADSVWPKQWGGEGQQFRQRSKGTGGNEWRGAKSGGFDAARVHSDGCAGDPGGLAQERRLALAGFDQIERHAGGKGQEESREAGARAEIDSPLGQGSHHRRKLQGICDVALPEPGRVTGSNQIDCAIPAQEERRKLFDRPQRFT